MAKPHRIGYRSYVIGASFLLAACATAPKAPPSTFTMADLPSAYPAAAPSRGALYSAVQMGADKADAVAAALNPTLLASRMNPEPMKTAGFFNALAKIRPRLKTVRQLRIHYWSTDAAGRPIKLSGLLMLPSASAGEKLDVPMLLLCHGTQLLRERVPSRLSGSERPIALLLAASGCAVAMPDYPGMGDGEGFHSYCHAQSLSHAGVDLLRAAREWIRSPRGQLAYAEAPRLWVAGYSEGGYAAMAVIRELENETGNEFALTAGYPMAGPFDMSQTMKDSMLSAEPSATPSYLPYTILGWLNSYGADMSPETVFTPEVVDRILPLMDGRSSSAAVSAKIAELQGVEKGRALPSVMMTAAFRSALADPTATPAGRRTLEILRENDLYDWRAKAGIPLTLMATIRDEQVPFANNIRARDSLIARGASVRFIELAQANHEAGAYEAYGYLLMDIWKSLGLVP